MEITTDGICAAGDAKRSEALADRCTQWFILLPRYACYYGAGLGEHVDDDETYNERCRRTPKCGRPVCSAPSRQGHL